MTTPNCDPMVGLHPVVGLHLDEADDLAWLLGKVEDWLRHAGRDTGGDTYDELVEFFNGPGHGRLAVAGLIEAIGAHAATLHRRREQAHTQARR